MKRLRVERRQLSPSIRRNELEFELGEASLSTLYKVSNESEIFKSDNESRRSQRLGADSGSLRAGVPLSDVEGNIFPK